MQLPSRSTFMQMLSSRTLRAVVCLLFTFGLGSVVLIVPWQHSRAADDQLTVTADADAFIDGNEPNKNFGASADIQVKDNPSAVGFVRFTVKGVPQGGPLRAHLRLFVTDDSAGAAANVYAFQVPNTWNEKDLTWNMQPALGNQLGASAFEPLNTGSWADIDLGNAVTGDGVYSFAITSNTPDRVGFAATKPANDDDADDADDTGNAPELVITIDTPPEPTDTFSDETAEATTTATDDTLLTPTETPTDMTPEATNSADDDFTPEPTDMPDDDFAPEPTSSLFQTPTITP